jgi:hypothetical protein
VIGGDCFPEFSRSGYSCSRFQQKLRLHVGYHSASLKTSNDYFHCSSVFILLHRMFIVSTKIFIYIFKPLHVC